MSIFSLASLYCLLLSFFGICALLHYLIYLRQVAKWKQSNIPFLKPMFLFGHRYFADVKKAVSYHVDRIYKDTEEHGIIAFFMSFTPVILVRDPKLIQQVFKKNFDKTHQNGFTALENDEVFQSTIFATSDKNHWKFQLSLMAPIFSTARLHESEEFKKIKKQVDNLSNYLDTTQRRLKPANVKEIASNFIVNTIALWGFGADINVFEKPDEIREKVRLFFAPTRKRMFLYFIITHFPQLQHFDWFRMANNDFMRFLRNLLIKSMLFREKHKIKQHDFIHHLMSLKNKIVVDTSDENSDGSTRKYKEITFNQVLGLTLTSFVAGIHTPAVLASYALHMISLHPDYQRRIKTEIDEVMWTHGVTELTPEVIQDLQFTEQCVSETARLYPVVPMITRRCTESFTIPETSYKINKGDMVIISPASMHLDSHYFDDPETFNPNRFSSENRGSISPETFFAYGYSPRKCPAYRTGNFLVVTFLASIVQKYEVKPRTHLQRIDLTGFHPLSFTNECKEDILVDLVPRETAV